MNIVEQVKKKRIDQAKAFIDRIKSHAGEEYFFIIKNAEGVNNKKDRVIYEKDVSERCNETVIFHKDHNSKKGTSIIIKTPMLALFKIIKAIEYFECRLTNKMHDVPWNTFYGYTTKKDATLLKLTYQNVETYPLPLGYFDKFSDYIMEICEETGKYEIIGEEYEELFSFLTKELIDAYRLNTMPGWEMFDVATDGNIKVKI